MKEIHIQEKLTELHIFISIMAKNNEQKQKKKYLITQSFT